MKLGQREATELWAVGCTDMCILLYHRWESGLLPMSPFVLLPMTPQPYELNPIKFSTVHSSLNIRDDKGESYRSMLRVLSAETFAPSLFILRLPVYPF